MTLSEDLEYSAMEVRKITNDFKPCIGIILGSGLGSLADQIENATCIDFLDVPNMKKSTATSHVGQFVFGCFGGKDVVVMQGRLHGYEGYDAASVAYPVWLMNKLGVETLITTNAAGAINSSYNVGDFCIICDHINFTGRNPVANMDASKIAPRFFSMDNAYDEGLRRIAKDVACKNNISVQEGVYLGLLGPSFETPAEIRAFRVWGADTVAMSMVWEVIAARHVGMKVLGISLVSNMACGVDNNLVDDLNVLEVAKSKENDFASLISGIVESI